MKTVTAIAAGLALFGLAAGTRASLTALTEAQVHAVIDPWYSQAKVEGHPDVQAIQGLVVSPDYQTCNRYRTVYMENWLNALNQLRAK